MDVTESIKFIMPSLKHKEDAESFIQEFYEYQSDIYGSGELDEYIKESNYEDWLKKLNEDIDVANTKEGRVPGLTYFCIRESDNKIIGMLNVRLSLNDFLYREGGHIGYSIRPTERRKGYSNQILKKAILILDRLNIKDIRISCRKNDLASIKIISKNNGELESEFYSETYDEEIRMYVIQRL